MLRAALAVAAAGLAVCVWYAVWGVHGCNDEGGNPTCLRMDRDFQIYLGGLVTLALGSALALAVGLRRLWSAQRAS